MLKMISLLACCLALTAGPALAGENPSAKLAMHVVASDEYLDCTDLMPASCESINVDVSVEELLAEGGYGYVALIAYDVTEVSAVEFALAGWSMGRGSPRLDGPHWCSEEAVSFGDYLEEGGATGLGACLEADENGMVLLGYVSFGPLDVEDLPVFLEYAPSTYTQPLEPLIGVTDCTPMYEIDEAIAVTGCTIGGTQLDQPWCGGREGGMDGGEGGGGLVWSMCLEPPDWELWDTVAREYTDENAYLLPGKEFPIPWIDHRWNDFVGPDGEPAPDRKFPISYFQFVKKGEPLYTIEGEGGGRVGIDYEWYVGFLPVNSDGTLPEEGIDWWSWEHGRMVEPERWVKPSFEWRDHSAEIAVSFSAGSLDFEGHDGAEVHVDLPFGEGYVAAFDPASRRLAVVGYDALTAEWHLSVLSATGTVVFEDPWDAAPTAHLHPSQDAGSLLYAVWEDETTRTLRPHVHPIPSDQPKRPAHPSDHPALGVYRVSLRTGKVRKEPGLTKPAMSVGYVPNPPQALKYSQDRRWVLRIGKGGERANVVAYYDESSPDAPTLLWEGWENRWVQDSAVSPGGGYVAYVMSGAYWPEGPQGPRLDDIGTTVLKLCTREGHVLGTHTLSVERHPYRHANVFSGPYLFVGYDGYGASVHCIYVYDMQVPWNIE